MKKTLLYLLLIFYFSGCSNDDELRINNPNLPDLRFTFQLDLNLPQYNRLNFPGNSFVTYNYGLNGVVIYNINNSMYTAFELTDPNHIPDECSVLALNGTEATCQCEDGNVYTVITGQQIAGQGQYPLKPYRILRRGNLIEVSN